MQLKDQGEHLLQQYKTLAQLRTAEQNFDLEWFSVQEGCGLLGRSLAEARVRSQTGVSVVGVLRSGAVQVNPGPDFRLQGKDMVAVIGSSEARANFHAMLVQGADQDMAAGAPTYRAAA